MSLLDIDLRPLKPLFRAWGDICKLMLKDDQKDLAFPSRSHRGMFHHYFWGITGFPFAEMAEHLIDMHEIIKHERFHKNDTPGTYLQRIVAIHNKTYIPPDDGREQERLDLLTQYMDQLRGEKNKKGIERKLENAIYMGKLKTKGQINEELIRMKQKKRYPKPPRVGKHKATQNKIMLYRRPS